MPPMPQPLKVLVVDDDALDRRAARRALRGGEQPVEVTEAVTCAEALARLAGDAPPDVVLLDYQLPDGDGLSLIRRVQALGLDVPVVMLTGHGDELVAVELMKAGAADYLSKAALTPETLWRSLRGILRLRRAEADRDQERRARRAALRQNEERLRFLYDTTSTPGLTFDQKVGRLLEEGCRQFGLAAGMLARVEGERYEVVRSWPADAAQPAGFVCDVGKTFCAQTLRQNDAFAVQDAADSEWRGHPARTELGVESYLGAVIRSGGRKWGNLAFNSARPHPAPFTAADREYVRLMAQWVGGELVRRQAEGDLRRSEERYRSLADATAQIIWTTSAGGEFREEQPPWSAFTGQTFGQARGWGWLTAVHPDDQWRTAEVWAAAVAGRAPYEIEHRLRRRDGVYRAMTARAVPVLEGGGAVREWVGVHTDITERQQAQDRLRVLAEAGALLAASLDLDQTLPALARLVVGALADRCAIDLLRPDGSLGRAAMAQTPGGDAADGAAPSSLCVPLVARGRTLGTITLWIAGDERRDGAADQGMAEELARRAALAVDNARLYAHERHVADRLQAAFLPDIPDHLHGLDLAKAYRSGLEEAQVGGDLYDAFALDDGRVGLVIADVSGKGLGAAVQTATVKYTLRAFAAEAAAPDLVLRRLNRTLCGEASGLGEHFVTLFYGVYEPATGRLTYTSAGHETQLIKRADGPPALLHANGPILGVADHAYAKQTEVLRPGDALILFTDGLTEARAAGTRALLEMEGVTAFVAGLGAGLGAGALTASLERLALDWTGGRPQDDLALLVARRVPEAAAAGVVQSTGLGDHEAGKVQADEFLFGFAFPSSPDYAAEVRQAVAYWMASLGFDRAQTEDFQTAVTEAVTNAVRHGSPGGEADGFRVSGYRSAQEGFAVEVADGGPGLPAPAAPPAMPAPEALGGRGLPLMHALADAVLTLPAEAGLHIRLVKTRRPAQAAS